MGTHRGGQPEPEQEEEEEDEEDEQDEENADTDLDIRADIDPAVNSAAIAAIIARNSSNRTTSFMQLPNGQSLFGTNHDAGLVQLGTGTGVRGSIRFNRNRMSANDFIVENAVGNVDYDALQFEIRMVLAGMNEYDYGDEARVRVK